MTAEDYADDLAYIYERAVSLMYDDAVGELGLRYGLDLDQACEMFERARLRWL